MNLKVGGGGGGGGGLNDFQFYCVHACACQDSL